MSEETVEVVQKLTEALNRRDVDAFVACLSPNVQWEENTAIYTGLRRVYRGPAEARLWFDEAILEFWDAFHFETEETVEGSDGRVFLGGLLTTRGKGSGIETQLRLWVIVRIADGAVTRRQVFLDRAEALETVGLRE